MNRLFALGLPLLLLAGCVSKVGPTDDLETDVQGWALDNAVTDCLEQVVVLFIPFEDAQAALPEGYKAADASALLGLPAPTGESAVFFNVVACEGGSSAELAVPIEAPVLENVSLAEVDYSLYQVGYVSDNASVVERLQAVGFPAFDGAATASADLYAVTGLGQGEAAGGDNMSYAFRAVFGPEDAFPGTARFWHQSEEGIVHFEYAFDSRAHKGTLVECSIPEGSLLHELSGRTDCQGAQTAVVAIPGQTWESTISFLPDARVA